MARPSSEEEGLGTAHCGLGAPRSAVPRTLKSHPLPRGEVLLEDCESSVTVTKAKGALCHVSVTATVPVPPAVVWEFLIHPDNELVFRQIDRTTFRRVLAEAPPAAAGAAPRRLVRTDTVTAWHFGPLFGGIFATRMLHDQDAAAGVLRFEGLPGSGGVSRLQGEWRLRPVGPSQPGWTAISLEQDIALAMWTPPMVRRAIQRVVTDHMRRIVEDLHEEAIRVAGGRPTMCPYETVRDKEVGERPEGGGTKAAARAQARRLSGAGATSLDLQAAYGPL